MINSPAGALSTTRFSTADQPFLSTPPVQCSFSASIKSSHFVSFFSLVILPLSGYDHETVPPLGIMDPRNCWRTMPSAGSGGVSQTRLSALQRGSASVKLPITSKRGGFLYGCAQPIVDLGVN